MRLLQGVAATSSWLRLRYFGARPLVENNRVRSAETVMLNAQVGCQINKTWTITAEILNLLDRRDQAKRRNDDGSSDDSPR